MAAKLLSVLACSVKRLLRVSIARSKKDVIHVHPGRFRSSIMILQDKAMLNIAQVFHSEQNLLKNIASVEAVVSYSGAIESSEVLVLMFIEHDIEDHWS